MNEENRKIIWSLIQETGKRMEGSLPSSPNHPKGRNPYAHILLLIKTKFNCSYKDIDDNKVNILKKFIKFIEDNPR